MWSQLQYPFLPSFSSHKGSTSIMDAAVSTESARKKGIFLLSQDLLSVIYSYLKPNNLIMMSKINKQFHKCSILRKAIIDMFKSNLNRILRCCGYVALDSVLERGKCVLSGSVILQAILGEEWWDSDIDLYSTFASSSEVLEKLAELGYFQFLTAGDTNDYIFNPTFGPTNFHGSKLSTLSEWGSTETKTGVWKVSGSSPVRRPAVLQMLVLNESVLTAEEAIIDFDWDIVMNTWDGKTLHVTAPTAVATKVTNAVENGYEILVKKYEIDNRNTETRYLWNKMLKRMNKYSHRGFKIMVGTDEWTKEKFDYDKHITTGWTLLP